jgi:hypothetical protein
MNDNKGMECIEFGFEIIRASPVKMREITGWY